MVYGEHGDRQESFSDWPCMRWFSSASADWWRLLPLRFYFWAHLSDKDGSAGRTRYARASLAEPSSGLPGMATITSTPGVSPSYNLAMTTRRSARDTPISLSMENHDHDRYGVVGELSRILPNSLTWSPTELPKGNDCITFKVASWGCSTRGLPILC